MATPYENPYDILRRRIALYLLVAVALAGAVLAGDVLISLRSNPKILPAVALAISVLLTFVVGYVQVLLAFRNLPKAFPWCLWLALSLVGYGLIATFGPLDLGQLALIALLALGGLSAFERQRSGDSCSALGWTDAARFAVLLAFLGVQNRSSWSTGFSSPLWTFAVNSILCLIVIASFGRRGSIIQATFASAAAGGITAALTVVVRLFRSSALSWPEAVIVASVVLGVGVIVGGFFGLAFSRGRAHERRP